MSGEGTYQVGDTVVVAAAFYNDPGVAGGEDVLADPLDPILIVVNTSGNQITGSPFSMSAITVAHTGIRYGTWDTTGFPAGSYTYTVVAEATKLVHANGEVNLENNDIDSLDSDADTNTTHLTDIKGAGWASTDTLENVIDNINTILSDTPLILTDTGEIQGAGFNTSTDSLEQTASNIRDARGAGFVQVTDSLEAMSNKLDDIQGSGFNTSTDSLEALRDKMDTMFTIAEYADNAYNELIEEHQTIGSFGHIVGVRRYRHEMLVFVNHNTGGTDNLTYEASSIGIPDARGVIYLTADYADSAKRVRAYQKATFMTDSNGHWIFDGESDDGTLVQGTYLPADDYTVEFYKPYSFSEGEYGLDTVTIPMYRDMILNTPGLIAYWPLDETSGGTVTDLTGNGHIGTVLSGVTLGSTGQVSNAPTLDGAYSGSSSTGHITVADDSAWELSTWSIEAWINSNDTSKQQGILEHYQSGGNGWTALRVGFEGFETDGTVVFFNISVDGGADRAVSSQVLSNDTWYHIVGTYDGATLKIYINGELDGTAASTRTPGNPTNLMRIGARGDSGDRHFNGEEDEVAIYNRALSLREIREHYIQGLVGA